LSGESFYFYGDVNEESLEYSILKSTTTGIKFSASDSNIYLFDIKYIISGSSNDDCFIVYADKILYFTHCYISFGNDFNIPADKSLFIVYGDMIVKDLIIDDITDTDQKLHLIDFGIGEKPHITWSKMEFRGFNGNDNNFYLIDFSTTYSSQHSELKVTNISECKFENFNLNKSLISIDVTQKLIFISCFFNNITVKSTVENGGVFNSAGDLECYNCEFKFCRSSLYGGVLWQIPANTDERYLNFTDCLLLNCSSAYQGGALDTQEYVYAKNLFLTLFCCEFYNNSSSFEGLLK
jgi:hypothetical protein